MIRYVAVALVLVVVIAGAWLVLGRAAVEATSSVDPDVTIHCDGSTWVTGEECHAWGDSVLGAGPPSHTFEFDDVARLDLTRALFGFSDTCEAAFFLDRYETDAVWNEEVPCPGG